MAGRLKTEVRDALMLENAFLVLQNEISFSSLSLSEAFLMSASLCEGKGAEFFKNVGSGIGKREGKSAEKIWNEELSNCDFSKEIKEILAFFGEGLGRLGYDEQLMQIKTAQSRILVYKNKALEKSQKNGKMYKGFGILSGLMIAVLLF